MTGRGWLLAGCLAAAAGAPAQPAPEGATPADPERQLQAIRDALVEKTLAAPVRVQSFGWIDTEGRLHESTQFTSDTRVRGVRVQAYVEDPAAPVRVQVDTSVLPAGLGQAGQADPERCLASGRRWRQALHVEAVGHVAPPLLKQLQQAFVDAARDSRRWVAQPRPFQPETPYEQAVHGRDTDRTEWLARIEVAATSGALQARIAVAPLLRPEQALRVRVPLSNVEVVSGAGSSFAVSPRDVETAMSGALAALERQGACEPLWYSVAGSGERLHLREGVAHGLQPGDRLLLVERQHLPARLLDPGAARALALVQVGQPSAHGTPLRWLAGPRPAQAGDWVALPL
ncbi:MAG: hypothetical protein RIS88_2456 [Pseudomonadota bacterium]|jgi:hypothetical protein